MLKLFCVILQDGTNKSERKKDLHNLKRINQWIFAFWKRHNGMMIEKSDENIEVIDQYINIIEEIQSMYIDILPIVCDSKTTIEMITNLTKEYNGRITFNEECQDIKKFAGYHDFLTMTLKILIRLIMPGSQSLVSCNIIDNTDKKELPFVEFNLNQHSQPLSVIEQGVLKVGCSLLNEIGKIYNIKIAVEIAQNEFALAKVVWQLS
ncbi:hypothetical protein [Sporomusa acidovorans]|uniref:Uncharacterized protein n=1 Tax=Sporomusa acidovorans (strain ATCC 49682 / DSM 3132 / Mol) TaxID=1123286 RepID=A0ABZ3J2J5_SPOA4|nr:hypothetical protein [Sporomusa acidovorans]OZC23222.1 hypothetical protein SPACI_08720 [Sporomusa acidovorans DSM 3132]SDE98019.1 hypothetical protein SAMN04488499_102857 [Sporomusa acidovorans]